VLVLGLGTCLIFSFFVCVMDVITHSIIRRGLPLSQTDLKHVVMICAYQVTITVTFTDVNTVVIYALGLINVPSYK